MKVTEMITREQVVKELADFFRDGLVEDGLGVCDWIAQGDYDTDEFIAAVEREFPKPEKAARS